MILPKVLKSGRTEKTKVGGQVVKQILKKILKEIRYLQKNSQRQQKNCAKTFKISMTLRPLITTFPFVLLNAKDEYIEYISIYKVNLFFFFMKLLWSK